MTTMDFNGSQVKMKIQQKLMYTFFKTWIQLEFFITKFGIWIENLCGKQKVRLWEKKKTSCTWRNFYHIFWCTPLTAGYMKKNFFQRDRLVIFRHHYFEYKTYNFSVITLTMFWSKMVQLTLLLFPHFRFSPLYDISNIFHNR